MKGGGKCDILIAIVLRVIMTYRWVIMTYRSHLVPSRCHDDDVLIEACLFLSASHLVVTSNRKRHERLFRNCLLRAGTRLCGVTWSVWGGAGAYIYCCMRYFSLFSSHLPGPTTDSFTRPILKTTSIPWRARFLENEPITSGAWIDVFN